MGTIFSNRRYYGVYSGITIIFAYLLPKIYRYYRKVRITKFKKCEPKIVIIGAGLSGLCAAIKLKTQLNYDNFIILERQKEVGGTWYTNTYPGCACDVPSYLYSYSFEQKYNWSKEYAPQPEILKYIQDIVKKYDLKKYIKFNTYATLLKYNEKKCLWNIHCKSFDGDSKENVYIANIVIQAGGGLTSENVKYPYSQKLNKYKGTKMHSGKWNNSYSFQGKNVAVVGSGTSAVNITFFMFLSPVQSECVHIYLLINRSKLYQHYKKNVKNYMFSSVHQLMYFQN